MTHDITDIAFAVACFTAAALILVGLVWWLRDWFDDWLDRRLRLDLGEDWDDTPIFWACVLDMPDAAEALRQGAGRS